MIQFLFAIGIDELTRTIQNMIPWYMLFGNDIVLVDETNVNVNTNLKI